MLTGPVMFVFFLSPSYSHAASFKKYVCDFTRMILELTNHRNCSV